MNPELQSGAEKTAEYYVRNKLGNPADFRSIAFSALQKRRYTTSLDSSMDFDGVHTPNHRDMERYVDSANGQRPDLAVDKEKDLYNIEHDKLTYYLLDYSFSVDSSGLKRFIKYRFELDTACNSILRVTDITHGHSQTD